MFTQTVDSFRTLLSPALRFEIGADGTLIAAGGGQVLGTLGFVAFGILGVWVVAMGDWAAVATGGVVCAAILPWALWNVLHRERIEVSSTAVRYARRLIGWSASIAPRAALSSIALVERRYEAESRFILFSTELRFSDPRLPRSVQVHQSSDLDTARAVGEMLSAALGCELREELR